MNKQYLIKVYPIGLGREVYRNIEISGEDTLDRLCQIILESFDFTDEHLYEFCMDNRMYQEYNYQSDPEEDEPSTKIILDELRLVEKQKFSLHYDFGDDCWICDHSKKISKVAEKIEACITKSKGYIQQYPVWDENEWDIE